MNQASYHRPPHHPLLEMLGSDSPETQEPFLLTAQAALLTAKSATWWQLLSPNLMRLMNQKTWQSLRDTDP